MNILAIEREIPSRIPPSPCETLRAEAAMLWDMEKHDVVRQLWSAGDGRVVMMLEAASAAAARHQLDKLPLVQTGRIEFSLIELHPCSSLEQLFAGGTAPAPSGKPEEPAEY